MTLFGRKPRSKQAPPLPSKRRGKKKLSMRQEQRIAGLGQGRRQPASGAMPGPTKKGDVRGVGETLIECKRTNTARISLSGEVFSKITAEAAAVGLYPVVQIDIDGSKPAARFFLVPGGLLSETTRIRASLLLAPGRGVSFQGTKVSKLLESQEPAEIRRCSITSKRGRLWYVLSEADFVALIAE